MKIKKLHDPGMHRVKVRFYDVLLLFYNAGKGVEIGQLFLLLSGKQVSNSPEASKRRSVTLLPVCHLKLLPQFKSKIAEISHIDSSY